MPWLVGFVLGALAGLLLVEWLDWVAWRRALRVRPNLDGETCPECSSTYTVDVFGGEVMCADCGCVWRPRSEPSIR